MKTIGLIGGISSFSTSIYYTTLNRLVNEQLGGAHSAKLILHSIDFQEFKILQEQEDWLQIEKLLLNIAHKLEQAGADCLVICSNTPHLVAEGIRLHCKIPLIHIAEVTSTEISNQALKRVGLLGTKFTMENNFFTNYLTAKGIEVILPDTEDRAFIHSSIVNEFTRGHFLPETKAAFLNTIIKLKLLGAEAIVFGCTEIILLLKQEECPLQIFDTTAIHAKAAVDFALH